MSILNTTHPRRRSALLILSVMLGLSGLVFLLATTQLWGEPSATPDPASQSGHTEDGTFQGTVYTRSGPGGERITDRIGYVNGDFVLEQSFDDGLRLRQRLHGKVKLDEGGRGIAHVAPDAFMVLATAMPGTDQRLEVSAGEDGEPRYDWSVNGRAREFDEQGRQWLEAALAVIADHRAIAEIRGQEGTLRGKIGTIRGREGTLRGKIGTIRGQEGTLRGKIGTIRGREGTLRGKIGTIRGRVGTLRGRIGSYQGQISGLRAERSSLEREGASRSQIDRVNERIADLEEKIRATEDEIKAFDVAGRIAEIEDEIKALDVAGRIAEIEDEIKALDVAGRVAEIEDEIKALRADERVEQIEARLESEHDELRRLMAQL